MMRLKTAAIAVVLLALGALVFLSSPLQHSSDDISCHYALDAYGMLPLHMPDGPAIFFHETSCRTSAPLNARQACAVESAARVHPRYRVYVLFLSPRSASRAAALRAGAPPEPDEGPLAAVLRLPNVVTHRVYLPEYAKGSPLEEWLGTPALNASRYRASHTSDALRFLTLWRHGGVYLDLDVVVTRSLDPLGHNWAGRESGHSVAAGAMRFSRDQVGRRAARAAVRELRATFRGSDWGHNGPGVLQRLLRRACGTDVPSLWNATRCGGLEVHPPDRLYPVPWSEWRRYTDEDQAEAERLLESSAYIHHMWNKFSSAVSLRVNSSAPYVALAARYCPAVHRALHTHL